MNICLIQPEPEVWFGELINAWSIFLDCSSPLALQAGEDVLMLFSFWALSQLCAGDPRNVVALLKRSCEKMSHQQLPQARIKMAEYGQRLYLLLLQSPNQLYFPTPLLCYNPASHLLPGFTERESQEIMHVSLCVCVSL